MKLKYLFAVISLFVSFFATAEDANRAAILRNKILNGDKSEVLVVAHRGDWRFAPENSIAAIEHSIATGVDIVELDLQMSKDSVLFVIHDSKLERTTTGKGRISDWTADSLKTLKLKNGAGIRTKHSLSTLEEVMNVAKGRVLVNLDKADRYFDQLMPVLEKTGTASQVIMKGGKPAATVDSLYGGYLDKVIYMPVIHFDKPGARELVEGFVNEFKPAAYELVFSNDTDAEYVKQLRKRLDGNALIWYNTLWDTQCAGHDDDHALDNPDEAYGYLIDTLGAGIIQTDRAELLLNYLRSRSLHK